MFPVHAGRVSLHMMRPMVMVIMVVMLLIVMVVLVVMIAGIVMDGDIDTGVD